MKLRSHAYTTVERQDAGRVPPSVMRRHRDDMYRLRYRGLAPKLLTASQLPPGVSFGGNQAYATERCRVSVRRTDGAQKQGSPPLQKRAPKTTLRVRALDSVVKEPCCIPGSALSTAWDLLREKPEA
jgi:hypothetical protein